MKNFAASNHELNPMSLMAFVLSLMSLIIVTVSMVTARFTDTFQWLITLDTLICIVFWIQLSADLSRSTNRRAFLRRHWIDYVASIPIIEPLRFARLFQVFRIIRLMRNSQDVLARLANAPRETTFASLILLFTLLLTLGSTSILVVESQAPHANIDNASDALWWVFVTISTVGYGDLYPVTPWGRVIAMVVIICGVAIFGMVAGLVTSAITKRHQPNTEWQQLLENQQMLLDKIEQLEDRLDAQTLSGKHQNNPETEKISPSKQ